MTTKDSNHDDSNQPESASRRRFLKLSALFTAAGALPLLQACERAAAAEPNAPVRVGYLPITDATPLLIAHHNRLWQKQGLKVDKPRMFRGWAQIVEAFLSGNVNVVHMLSPMTLYARYGSRLPSQVVAWNHVDGSALAIAIHNAIPNVAGLGGTTFAIPFWYSVHNVILQVMLKQHGITPIGAGTPTDAQVKLVVMAPSDMLPALAVGRISGYIVAEPFVALSEIKQFGRVLRFTGDVWKNHACCVVQMHQRDIDRRPEWTQKLVNGIVEAQAWTRSHRDDAAHILARSAPNHYTPHEYPTLAKVLAPPRSDYAYYESTGAIEHTNWDAHRIDFQPYPYPSYTAKLVELLKHTVVEGKSAFLDDLDPTFAANDLVDDRFVRKAIARVGGMRVFDQPESFTRHEIIKP